LFKQSAKLTEHFPWQNRNYASCRPALKLGQLARRDEIATMILIAYRHGLRAAELVDLTRVPEARPSTVCRRIVDRWGRRLGV
jgi:hypothetical protein